MLLSHIWDHHNISNGSHNIINSRINSNILQLDSYDVITLCDLIHKHNVH